MLNEVEAVRVVGSRLLIQREEGKKMDGVIHLAQEKKSEWATVIKVGPEVTQCKEGDRIYFDRTCGLVLEMFDGEEKPNPYLLLDEDAVMLVQN